MKIVISCFGLSLFFSVLLKELSSGSSLPLTIVIYPVENDSNTKNLNFLKKFFCSYLLVNIAVELVDLLLGILRLMLLSDAVAVA